MSNRTKRSHTLKADQKRQTIAEAEAASSRRLTMILVGAGAVALIIVILVIALAGGGDDDSGGEATISFNGTPLPAFVAGSTDSALGQKAPLFVTSDLITGEQAVVGGGGGPNDTAKVVLFAAHWCPTCQAEIPEVADWLNANPLPDGVEFVAVSTFPDPGRGNHPPSDWFEDVGWPYPVMADNGEGAIAGAYGMSSVPSWVVLDDQNFVLARTTGAIGDAGVEQLVALAAGA